MELLTIRECSLGAFAEALQEAILQGYRHSQDPTRYAWMDNQYNTILERVGDVTEPSTEEPSTEEQPTKKLAGRPPRKP